MADTIEDLARKISLPVESVARTVDEFNAAVQPGEFNPDARDGKSTMGLELEPPKSNWALPIDSPPYTAYAVACGITFTYGGIQIDPQARVIDTEDNPIPNLYATGEITGNFFYHNYPGGAGLSCGGRSLDAKRERGPRKLWKRIEKRWRVPVEAMSPLAPLDMSSRLAGLRRQYIASLMRRLDSDGG